MGLLLSSTAPWLSPASESARAHDYKARIQRYRRRQRLPHYIMPPSLPITTDDLRSMFVHIPETPLQERIFVIFLILSLSLVGTSAKPKLAIAPLTASCPQR